MKKANIYIDGFNFFYGCLKHNSRKQYRWVNPEKLIKMITSKHFLKTPFLIQNINFYTARIVSRYKNDNNPYKQQNYFNALKTIKNLKLYFGNFISKPVIMPKFPLTKDIEKVKVLKTEEKGSDVNLATHLVYDACKNNFDLAIIITNDTDLVEPIRLVRENLKKEVIVICPHKNIAFSIKKLNVINLIIKTKLLKASQFDKKLNEKVECPLDWR